jgi:hypothetical protein
MLKTGPNWKNFYRWKGMVVNSGNWRSFLQKRLGSRRVSCGGATWRAAFAGLTPCSRGADAGSWTDLKGYAPLLIWAVRADQTALVARGRGRRGGDRPAAAPADGAAAARRRRAKWGSRAPYLTRFGPGGREERREAHQGVVDGGGAV